MLALVTMRSVIFKQPKDKGTIAQRRVCFNTRAMKVTIIFRQVYTTASYDLNRHLVESGDNATGNDADKRFVVVLKLV